MEIVRTIAEVRARLEAHRAGGGTVGFVPTMGYLHAGHASLVEAAAADDLTVVSIFVNPLQFAPHEDLDAYPRDLDHDVAVCEAAGADLVFAPPVEEMYPRGEVDTTVTVRGVSAPLEGASRPTHFAGVATVVAKLFSIVGPCRAYFGAKDWQQVAVVRRMTADLSMPVEVVACPIVREPDGLALSSRNVYLGPEERAQATVLRRALDAGVALVGRGETDPVVVEAAMADVVATADLAELDYVAAVPADTLVAEGPLDGEVRLLVAVRFGRARLIDNDGCRTIGS